MNDKLKNILIGSFVSGAIGIMVAMILFLQPKIGDGKKSIQVRFSNIAGISKGTRVTFAGRPVGEVAQIKELPAARDHADEMGRVFLYELTLKFDSSVDVYTTDEIAIRTTGLMGEKSVGILPKAVTPDKQTQIVTTEILFANSVDPLENTFAQMSRVSSRIEGAVGRFDQWFAKNEAPLTNVILSAHGALSQVDKVLASVDGEKLVPAVKDSVNLLSDNLRYIRTSLDDEQLLHKISSLTENLDLAANAFNNDGAAALRNLSQISRDIASGSGTLGRLIVGDDFYLRLASLMNKGETLMNDINHYGILFQYNKGWQKGRTRKANLLKALDTPQEFRNYFEGEVDSMTTSIGRLSELMDRAGSEERANIMDSEAFKRNFASLLRQVQGLTDSLKLYNEGLIAQSESQ